MSDIIKLKLVGDKYVIEKSTIKLLEKQKDYFENLPPYYHQVNFEVDEDNDGIIINHVTVFSDDVIKNITYKELLEWFYHNPNNYDETNIMNGLYKPVLDWNNLSKEQQDWIIKEYKNNNNKEFIESLVGFENVNKKMFRTWEDVEKELDVTDKDLSLLYPNTLPVSNSLSEKLFAMFKIHILIELGYGKNITENEWEYYEHDRFWGYVADEHSGKIILTPIEHTRHFPTFHTEEQAEKFGSYKENMDLLKIYLS